jgi:hypothetical protein
MMNVFKIVLVSSFLFVSHFAYADPSDYGPQHKRFGVGLIIGEPTGLTGKGYLTQQWAIDGIVSWSFVDKGVTLISDATYDFFDLPVETQKVTIPFYVGVGAKLTINKERTNKPDKTSGAIRVPIGLAAQWTDYPIEVFLELAPGIEIAPETEFDVTGGIGARFYF